MLRLLILVLLSVSAAELSASQDSLSTLEGYIYDRFTGRALPQSNIILNGGRYGRAADRNGFYSFKLPRGLYTITVRFVGYESESATLFIPADSTVRRDFYLTDSSYLLEGVTITARVPPADTEPIVITRNINVGEIERLSGIVTDPMRAMHTLTGVASNNELSAEFFIRGGNPDENLILIDHFPVVDPYYFSYDPRTSVGLFNANLIERVQLIQGTFPPGHGNALASVVRMTSSDRAKDRSGVTIGLSLMQAFAAVEGGGSSGLSYAAALRGTTPLNYIGSGHPFTETDARLYDIQGVVRYNHESLGNHRVFYLAGRDTYGGDYDGWSENFLLITSTQYRYGSDYALRFFSGVQYRDLVINSRFAETVETRFNLYSAKLEAERTLKCNLSLTTGLSMISMPVNHERTREGELREELHETLNNISLYGQVRIRPLIRTVIISAGRLDHFSFLKQFAASGSINVSHQIDERWTVRGGVGHYIQPPRYRGISTASVLGTSGDLNVQRSTNFSAGAEGIMEENSMIRFEIFYRLLDDIMIQQDVRGLRREYSGYNDGSAYARGFDFEFRIEDDRVTTWIGITIMQAREKDHRLMKGPYHRTNSQTFTVNLVFDVNMGGGFFGNMRALYGRGFYYNINDAREKFPEYRRIDVRFSKVFLRGRVFLDIMNIWNIRNVTGGEYSIIPDWDMGPPRLFNAGFELRI